jgi:hypothetical protein
VASEYTGILARTTCFPADFTITDANDPNRVVYEVCIPCTNLMDGSRRARAGGYMQRGCTSLPSRSCRASEALNYQTCAWPSEFAVRPRSVRGEPYKCLHPISKLINCFGRRFKDRSRIKLSLLRCAVACHYTRAGTAPLLYRRPKWGGPRSPSDRRKSPEALIGRGGSPPCLACCESG